MAERRLGCMLAACLVVGCAGNVTAAVNVVRPPPLVSPSATGNAGEPAPPVGSNPTASADADGDGVGEADACPKEAESKNGYRDEDGCPDELPAAYLSGHDVKLKSEIAFSQSGALDKSAEPLLDAIAALLGEHADIDTLNIGSHLAGGRATDRKAASEARAKSIRDALVKRGVKSERLSVTGHGDACAGSAAGPTGGSEGAERVAIELRVFRRGGNDTGAPKGCKP